MENTVIGNVVMAKKEKEKKTGPHANHPATKWVNDLIATHAEPSELTETKEDLGRHIGKRSKGTIYRYLNGFQKFSRQHIVMIGEFFGVDPPKDLLRGGRPMKGSKALVGNDMPESNNVIPLHPPMPEENGGNGGVIYPVCGVLFVRYAEKDKVTQPKINQLSGPRAKKYPNAKNYTAWESSDLSMNESKVFEDTYVLCVDLEDAGGNLENGMLVVVERTKKFDGSLERVLREVVVTPNGIEFHPRTSEVNENFAPFSYDGDDQVTVKILGVMVGTYRDEL